MKERVRQAVVKLTLLQDEFTRSELDEAVSFLSNHETHDVIEYFTKAESIADTSNGQSPAKDTDRPSKIVRDLAISDPEHYRDLSEFESMVRAGDLLPSFHEIKRLGMSISKSFKPAKSRRDTIPRLMALLAQMPFDKMKETIRMEKERAKLSDKDGSSYARLAEYLIGGVRGDAAVADN